MTKRTWLTILKYTFLIVIPLVSGVMDQLDITKFYYILIPSLVIASLMEFLLRKQKKLTEDNME